MSSDLIEAIDAIKVDALALEKENEELEAENELYKDNYGLIPIKGLDDELKIKVLARLHKNLSLEQLENLEIVAKQSFKSNKKNYILELP